MSYVKSVKEHLASYEDKESVIFHECKDDTPDENCKKFILQDPNSLESTIEKCIQNPTTGMSIEEDMSDFPQMEEHTNEDGTVTLVYQHDGMTLLSAGDERLVNLVELSSMEGEANSLDLDPENLEYSSARVLLQQDFDSNGEIAVVTAGISDRQLELLQSRLQGNETIALFQGETNLIDKNKVNESPIGNHLIHIPTSEVLDNNSIPLSLISESKGVQVIQNLDRHFLTVQYENSESLLPITLRNQDLLASEDSAYSSSRRNSNLLDSNVSEELLCEDSLTKKSIHIKLKAKVAKQGQVGRPKKNHYLTIGKGPNEISSEGVIQEINNRLVTVLPRPEDLKKLIDNRQLVMSLKRNGRGVSKTKIMSKVKQLRNNLPPIKDSPQNEDDMEASQRYVDLAVAKESKSFWNQKQDQQKRKKITTKNNTVVISSTGRKPGRPRKVPTMLTGSKGPKIIHTGPNNDKTSTLPDVKIVDETTLFNTEDITNISYKETEFEFFSNMDILKKKLPPRKRGQRYRELIEELQRSDSDEDSFSEDDESPDFLNNKPSLSPKPKIKTGKRGRPRKHPIEENSITGAENNGTRIIQLGENLKPIGTSTSSDVLVRDGKDSSDKSVIETQDDLIITFEQTDIDVEEDISINVIPTNEEDLTVSKIHIDPNTNISLVPQYDTLESTTIFIKEDGAYEEGFLCVYCQNSFEFKRDFLRHLKLKHGVTPLECKDCGKSFTSASSLRNHEPIHGLENSYCCNICNEGFSTYAELKDHQVIHTGDIICHICKRKFSNEESYQNHIGDCSVIKCKLCFDSFETKHQLELHKCQCTDKRFMCDICSAYFLSSSGLNRHRKVHTRSNIDLDKGLKCLHCMADFSFQETLDVHIQSVHGDHTQNLNAYGYGTNVLINMKESHGYAPSTSELYDVPNEEEIRDQSTVQPFLCGICDCALSDIDLLCDHFNSCHTGEQPMFCDVCSVGCASESQLMTHMKIHMQEEIKATEHSLPTEEYPFVCKLCSKRFRKENDLEKHTKLHNEERKYKCNQCNSSFMIMASLDKHLLVHSGQRPYVCDICFKGFRQCTALVRHKLWTHRLKNKNKCEICCKTFFSRSLLLFHLESHGELGKAAKERMQMESAGDSSPDGEHCSTDELTCELCGMECTSVPTLVAHTLSHKGPSVSFSCNVCHRSFKEKKKLKKHRLKHKNVKAWACDICGKAFATKLTRVRHSHVHLREALNPIPKMVAGEEYEGPEGTISSFPYELYCKECNVSFQHKSHFVRHKLLHAGIPLFKCGICGKLFVHKSDIFRHKVMHSFMFSCEICGKNFHKRSLYLLHTNKHLNDKPFKCDVCGKRFSTSSNYQTHSRIHSGEKPYKCNMCNYSCTQSGRLMKHRQVHSGIKMYSCDICNKQLATIDSVKVHSQIHSIVGDRPYKCSQCPKSFLKKGSLTVHMRDHFKEETYKCDTCSHKFKKEVHLAKHKLFHQIQQQYVGSIPNEVYAEHLGTPLYMCQICGRVFNKKKYLYNHHNVHSRSRKFSCTFCSKILLSKIAMRNHVLIHSGEMPHKCRICNKEFRNLSNMKRHERSHTTQEIFTCDECNATFYDERVLEEHKQVHLNLIMMDSVVDPVNSSVTQQLYVFDSVEESMNAAMNTTQQLLVDNNQQQFLVDGSQSLLVFPENSNTYSEIAEPDDHNIEVDNGSLGELSPREAEVIQTVTQMKPAIMSTDEKLMMKPHQCDVCFKTFAKRQYLTKHKYRHRDVKPHPCDICGKRFAQKFEVAVHKMKHTGDKPYRCDECGKDFRGKANLVNHKMKHSGEYPYMCSICDKGLSTQLQLEKHVSLHTGTYPYKCSLCQKGFSMGSSLAKHLEKAHIVNMEDGKMDESEVESNLEAIRAISSITGVCKDGIKTEFTIPMENDLEESFSVQVQPQYLKTCLLSESSVSENKFLSSILQPEEPSGSNIDVTMTESDTKNIFPKSVHLFPKM